MSERKSPGLEIVVSGKREHVDTAWEWIRVGARLWLEEQHRLEAEQARRAHLRLVEASPSFSSQRRDATSGLEGSA